jgi:hypothetical protein
LLVWVKVRAIASLLFVFAVTGMLAGCGPHPIPPLTDADVERMVGIAMQDLEVVKWLADGDYTTELGWVVIAWEDSTPVGWYSVSYEDIKDGTPPQGIAYVTDDVTINPQLYVRVGQPAWMFVSVIFDSAREKVLSIELQPGRPSPGPSAVDTCGLKQLTRAS